MNKHRLISALVLMALLLGMVAQGANRTYAADSRTFPETGQTVSGRFLDYWNSHGGLSQQGYPISGEMQEQSDTDGKTYTVQYFERAVFELHPENAAPYDVLLSLLGTFFYNEKYKGNAPGQKASTTNPRNFTETGKTVGGVFRTYWESHGGLDQQGFPISNEFQEVSATDGKTYTVQYFQRAVFELHPENAGTDNEVLLSLLGTFTYKNKYGGGGGGGAPTPTPTPAPPAPPSTPFAAAGWTNVVVTTNNIVLFYNAQNGTGETAKVGDDGTLTALQNFPDAATGNGSFSAGWTHIVAAPNNQLLFYNEANGGAALVSVGDDGIDHQTGTYQYAPGWSYIAIDTETGRGIFYMDSQNLEVIAQLQPDGQFPNLKEYPGDPSPALYRWNQFVPLGGGSSNWLQYVQGNGDLLTAKVNPDGTYTDDFSYTGYSNTWSNIVSDSTSHLLFYDKTNGATMTASYSNAGDVSNLKSYSGLSTGWTNVVGTKNHVFLFYDISGKIATDQITDDGSELALQRYAAGN